jgi:hypothetical protein
MAWVSSCVESARFGAIVVTIDGDDRSQLGQIRSPHRLVESILASTFQENKAPLKAYDTVCISVSSYCNRWSVRSESL